MTSPPRTLARYPIRAVSRMTGIGIDTLRAWERRHHAVAPVRDDRGRLYSDADIARLRLLRGAVEQGHATFHPVGDGKARPHEHQGVEVIYVMTGELGVTVEGVEHTLESGDAMYFDASVPHSYRRLGRRTCSALIVSVM